MYYLLAHRQSGSINHMRILDKQKCIICIAVEINMMLSDDTITGKHVFTKPEGRDSSITKRYENGM